MGWGKIKLNPRGRVRDWKVVLREIEKFRKKGFSILQATSHFNIAVSTYYEWKKRLIKERKK